MNKEQMKALYKKLQANSKRITEGDRHALNAFEIGRDNIDDAYWDGVEDGESRFARQLLQEFFEE